jgi:hypothetical protein
MNTEASLINQQPAVRCPWLGKEIEKSTQTRGWRVLSPIYHPVNE